MAHQLSDLSLELSDRGQHLQFLNLGCGGHFHSFWTNVDFTATGEGVIPHNLRQPFPFEDESFNVVYHSHVLEHFSRTDAPTFLRECLRVLCPGGILRVVVPDLECIARLYLQSLENALDGSTDWAHHYHWILLEMYDQVVRNVSGGAMADYCRQDVIANEAFVVERLGLEAENLIRVLRGTSPQTLEFTTELTDREALLRELLGDDDYEALQIGRFRQSGEIHQWMYDRYSLTILLEQVGFEAVTVCQHDESTIPGFREFCLDTLQDGRVRKPDSLFVEARKANVSPQKPQNVFLAETTQIPKLRHRVPPKPLEDLPQVQYLRQQVNDLQQQVSEYEDKLGRSRNRVRRFKTELKQMQNTIAEMERSGFWKVRSYWQRIKRFLKR